MSNNKNKLDAKSKQLIIGIFAVLILLTFSAVMLIAAYNFDDAKEDFTTTTTENTTTIEMPSTTLSQNVSNNVSNNNNQITSNVITSETETQKEQEPISVEGLEEFTKTGDNQISDSPENEFIKLVVTQKGADPERLVAIYAVPDLGNNFVLEFDDKLDDNGNIIRSPKTLKKIYHINKERNITVATGKPTGNEGVDYGTSLMTYYLVTDVVMPEFPDYFTDVG